MPKTKKPSKKSRDLERLARFKRQRIKDYSELERYFEIQKWIKGLSSKDHNRRRYLGVLEDFIKFTRKTPKELIDEEEDDRKKGRRNQVEPAKKWIKDFYQYCMEELGNSANTAKWKTFSVVAGFYSRNGFPVHFHRNETPAIAPPVNEKIFKVNGKMEQDLKKVLKLLLHNLKHLRDKAILTMLASSGMDMVDLFKLRYKDVKRWLNQDEFVIYEYVREKVKNKVRIPAVTVFTLESLEYLRAYLNQEYPKNENGEIDITDEDYVFISLGKLKHKKKRMTENRFSTELAKICESIHIQNVTPKSLRRYCFTKLEDSGLPRLYKNLWLGHTSELSDAYDLWSKYPEKLREIYAQAIPYVTIGNGYVKISSQLEELQKENKELRGKLELLEEKMKKQEELNARILKFLEKIKE